MSKYSINTLYYPPTDASIYRDNSTSDSDKSDSNSALNVTQAISSVDDDNNIKHFYITFDDKLDHQWSSYNKTSSSIYINNKNGPVLHLYQNITYYFHVVVNNKVPYSPEKSYNSFMFTTSPCGGHNALLIPNAFSPISRGVVCFRVSEKTPRYFFYQNFYEQFQGGLVIVHE